MAMRILSLGAGVQSSTLLLLGCRGEEQIDAAIFADTQWEPQATYRHLEWLEGQAQAAGIPIYRVTHGNLREAALAGTPEAWMPLRAANELGKQMMLRRQCTRHYKLAEIRRQVQRIRGGQPVEQLIGISLDEAHRMKDSGVRFIQNVYPLIERNWTRQTCLHWMAEHGYPRPPKSSCIGCPYKGDADWRRLRDDSPEEWADAVAFDAAIRTPRAGFSGPVYLHRSLRPLAEVDLRTPQEHGQLDLFGEECEGVCGV